MWFAILIISIACAAHCAWMANLFATVSDNFPKRMVASITGIGGMAGSVGGIVVAKLAGILFDHYKAMDHTQRRLWHHVRHLCTRLYLGVGDHGHTEPQRTMQQPESKL